MAFKLEQLEYQEKAIQSVVDVFKMQERNTFDSACHYGVRSNIGTLSQEEIQENIKEVISRNGIPEEMAQLSTDNDLCIEMETGTGKTLVYLKTFTEIIFVN
ncbi:MAG TPA: DEAD/DEAH box helicase family protein [Fodinibius sp.]|nr:DEAD/DEAH box helicase family protein [Fodinibius sp.]